MAADRIIAVRFTVDSREAETATKKFTESLQRLDANFKAAADGQGKLTGEMGKAFRAQLAYERKIDSTAKFVQEYWKAEQLLIKAKKAGQEVTEEEVRSLQRLGQEMVKQIALNSRLGSVEAFGPGASMSNAKEQIAATRAEMNKLMSTQNSVLGMLNNFSFKLFVITFAIRQAAETLLRAFVQTGEQVEKLRARIEMLGGDADTFDSLYQSAQKLGVSLQEYAGTFTRFAVAREQIGATNDELLQMTETLAQLGILGGGTAQEIGAGMQQLAQGFASGRLQGDELRSVLENMPLVAVKLADALEVPVGALREMGSQGELTGQVMLEAFQKVAPEVQRMFENLPLTTDRALAAMRNSWSLLINELLRATGSEGLANSFMGIADALEAMAKYVKENAALFARLIDVAAKAIPVMAGLFVLTQIYKWIEAAKLAALQMRMMSAAAQAAGVSMFKFNASAAGLLAVANPIAAVLGIVGGLIWSFSASADEAAQSAESLAMELDDLEASLSTLTRTQLQANEAKILNAIDQLNEKIQDQKSEVESINGVWGQLKGVLSGMPWEEQQRDVAILRGEIEKNEEKVQRLEGALERNRDLQGEVAAEARNASDAMRDQAQAAIQDMDALEKLTDRVADLKLEYQALRSSGSGAVKAFQAEADIRASIEANDMQTAIAKRDAYVYEFLNDQLRERERLQERATKSTRRATAAVKEETKAYQDLVKQYLPLKSVAEEYAEVQERVNKAIAAGDLSAAEGAQILARAREEMYERARKAEEQFTEASKGEATEWQKLWESTVDRVDDAFASMWEDLLNGTKSTMDTLKNLVLKTVAEIAHRLITQPLVLNVAAGFGLGGAAATAAAGQGGTGGLGGIGSLGGLGNLGSLLTGTSLGQTAGNLLWSSGLGQQGGALTSATINLAGAPNWALGGGALAGGLLGNLLFGGQGQGSIGSGVGSTAGSLLAAGAGFGPVGMVLGGLLGGLGGGFLGSMFGDKTEPRAQWVATPSTSGFEDGVFARSNALGLSFGLGGKSHGVEAEEYRQTLQGFATLADLIGTAVGEGVSAQIRERVSGVTDQKKGPGLAVDGWSAEAAFQHIFSEILDFGAETGDLMAVLLEERVGTLSGALEEMAGQITAAVAELQLLPQAVEGFETLGLTLGDTKEASYRAAMAIADMAGGIDALMTAQEFYYQNFFTETERLQRTYNDTRNVIVSLNTELGRSEDATLDTREELREFIEGLDLTTEAGQKAYITALKLAPAIVQAEEAMDRLNDTAGAAADAGRELDASITSMTDSLQDSIDSITAMQQSITEMLSGTAEGVLLRMMDDEQKYGYYKDKIDAETARLSMLTDAAAIEASIERINRWSQAATGLLDTDQLLAGMGQGWLDFLDEVQGLAVGRLEDIKGQQEDALSKLQGGADKAYEAAAMLVVSGERMFTAADVFQAAALTIQNAAASMPSRITVELVDRQREVA